jgi:hypothetical protein
VSNNDHSDFLKIADEAMTHLKRLSKDYPKLVSPSVKQAIENWGKDGYAKGSIELVAPDSPKAKENPVATAALLLIQEHQVEDVIDMLNREFPGHVDYDDLIDMVGKDSYLEALKREVMDMRVNFISNDQVADLWNSMERPAMGGQRWTAEMVGEL